MPNVQWRISGDGQRNCPKHVEFLDKNKFGKISASFGFIKKKFVMMQHGHMNIKLVLAFHQPCIARTFSSSHLAGLLRTAVTQANKVTVY
jgi:hypothetical protein